MQAQRSHYLDQWKGAAILAVVAIHASTAALDSPAASVNWIFGLMVRQPINFAVPMFLALSGYFAGHRQFETAVDSRAFWRDRFGRLLLPYFVWSFATIALRSPGHLFSAKALVQDILFGCGIGVGYFVIVLAQCVALTPVIARLKTDWHHVTVMTCVTAVGLSGRYYLQMVHPDESLSRFPFYALPFVAWYPFYHLGFWLRRRNFVLTCGRGVILGFACLFLLASVTEGWLLAVRGFVEFGVSQCKLSSFLMSGSLVLLVYIPGKHCVRAWPLLEWFGRNSYSICLSHILFMGFLSSALVRWSGLWSFMPAFCALLFVTTAAMSAIAAAAIQRVVPGRLATKWFGVAQL